MDETTPPSPPPGRLSKTPSWVMLGFILGAIFVWSLPRHTEPPPVQPAAAKAPPAPAAPPAPLPLTDIEAVFEEWGGSAVWENDTTQVALWDPAKNAYTRDFEVLRVGDRYYFRSLPRLTRPVFTRGIKSNSPLEFTEPEAHREEWLKEVREENARAFSKAAREMFNPGSATPPNPSPAPGQTAPGDGR